jgi:hypothetical protein
MDRFYQLMPARATLTIRAAIGAPICPAGLLSVTNSVVRRRFRVAFRRKLRLENLFVFSCWFDTESSAKRDFARDLDSAFVNRLRFDSVRVAV